MRDPCGNWRRREGFVYQLRAGCVGRWPLHKSPSKPKERRCRAGEFSAYEKIRSKAFDTFCK